MVKVLGLTGGIGTGKSTAAEFFRNNNFAHIDADQISRNLTADGSSILPVLDELFGPNGEFGDGRTEILDENGNLIRKAMAAVVFSEKKRRQRLNELMFKEIIGETDRLIEMYKSQPEDEIAGILIDAPLLFEAGLDDRCDKTLLLTADIEVRLKRVCLRDNATEEEVMNRIRNQLSDDEKIKLADAVIDNSDGIDELFAKLQAFLDELEENG
jgi:dephospho-CoA kinase